MGGRALKYLNIETRRYSVEEYNKLLPEVLELAGEIFPKLHATTYFRSKSSFGDADILCLLDSRGLQFDYNDIIREKFKSKGVSRNDNVISFEYKDFQIDFILTLEENWETSKIYYSYNDLSQYVGKIANQFGIKFGVEGLKYVQDGFDIVITKDHNKSLEFLGFDSKRYNEGFDSIDEIQEYVFSSKYFTPHAFQLENLSKAQRDRDARRENYMKLLEKMSHLEEREYPTFHKDKKVYLGLVDHYFPGFLKNIQSILDKINEEKERRLKINYLYNGLLIRVKFNLNGAELGNAMRLFWEHFGSKDLMEKWVFETDNQEVILNKFKEVNSL